MNVEWKRGHDFAEGAAMNQDSFEKMPRRKAVGRGDARSANSSKLKREYQATNAVNKRHRKKPIRMKRVTKKLRRMLSGDEP